MHDLFEEFKGRYKNPNYTWGLYWRARWTEQIALYLRLGFHTIAIQKGLKVPVANTPWKKEESLSRQRMMDYTEQGFNLAIVAGFCKPKITILDYDSKDLTTSLQDAMQKTLTCSTPNGFAFFLRGTATTKAWESLKTKYPWFDTIRDAVNYELAPLSKTCTRDKGGAEHNCEVHDYRIRTWINPATAPMDFDDFVEII